MPAIRIIAWINFIAAGVLMIASLNRNPFLLSPAIVAAISGCLFLAIDKALTLLTEIRDRLPQTTAPATERPTRPIDGAPIRSIADIEADLIKMKSKIQA